jgi:hypothetical protein
MKRLLLTTASLALAAGFAAAAMAQDVNDTMPRSAPVYGAIPGSPPPGAVAPAAPPGYHYEWVYAYDHHGYKGHWEAVKG